MPKTELPKETGVPQYGWRYLKVARPNGQESIEVFPLREEDLLHPQEGESGSWFRTKKWATFAGWRRALLFPSRSTPHWKRKRRMKS